VVGVRSEGARARKTCQVVLSTDSVWTELNSDRSEMNRSMVRVHEAGRALQSESIREVDDQHNSASGLDCSDAVMFNIGLLVSPEVLAHIERFHAAKAGSVDSTSSNVPCSAHLLRMNTRPSSSRITASTTPGRSGKSERLPWSIPPPRYRAAFTLSRATRCWRRAGTPGSRRGWRRAAQPGDGSRRRGSGRACGWSRRLPGATWGRALTG
jgi:hypothetical protein